MEKNQVYRFVQNYITEFGKPDYNPYRSFDEQFMPGLLDLGFKPSCSKFLEKHPEFKDEYYPTGDVAWTKAFAAESDLQTLGDVVLYQALSKAKSCWSLDSIDFKWFIAPLKRMAELCKQ